MSGRDFLDLAYELIEQLREADWRSAVSRAYYAGFHVARELLIASGFAAPLSEQAHSYLWRRLSNCDHADVREAALSMNDFRRIRNWADYDIHRPMTQQTAFQVVETVDSVIKLLEQIPALPHVHAQIMDAIKTYERDILKEETWNRF